MRFLSFLLLLASIGRGFSAEPMNVVLMLIDDLGRTDLGCYGSKFYETPHLDRLAADGMKFTQAYSACTVCSPTRAALMTGKYPARLRITDWISGHERPFAKLRVPDWTKHLPLEERTLAEELKAEGYATLSLGKWHLGGEAFYPEKQGFDANVGGTHRGQPPSFFSPYGIATLKDGPKDEFLTDREADEACQFIEANQQKPFFIYLPHHAVHTPIQGKPEVVEKYRRKAENGAAQGKPAYAALLESVDDSVGKIRAKLEALQLWDRTIFVFTSDNGGFLGPTSNLGCRAGKGSAYEGGVQVPLLIRWPGKTKPGSESAMPVITMDIFATLLAAPGKAARGKAQDGVSLEGVLAGEAPPTREAIFWHYPHYHPGGATPYSAVRAGDWKLLHFYEDDRIELYNLKTDPLEANNLADTAPDEVKRLRGLLEQWLNETKAQLPTPNPQADPAKDGNRSRAGLRPAGPLGR